MGINCFFPLMMEIVPSVFPATNLFHPYHICLPRGLDCDECDHICLITQKSIREPHRALFEIPLPILNACSFPNDGLLNKMHT
ncbi:hypothetical protein CEXT_642481 [Caerostris extrusa]|uniref:Uncharacterized protein n=1 Tax=Caerostris extrusa TaxID=172846 RepID=A0AAV4X8D6_CAEEX|nr:hypothetical protein CEXT_642481 [Caerostris extrusa]